MTAEAARSLFKLMAYKDEYEVARLHTATAFPETLNEEFEKGYRLVYYMAPPLLSFGKDSRGRPAKRRFGPWLTPALRGLARLRRIRGTWLDPFGYMQERREEVALIAWYEDVLVRLGPRIDGETAKIARRILAAPMAFRGYGPVKAKAIAQAKPEAERMLAGLSESTHAR
jgi:indolepyruvate ferredoxin oxidoreductase